MESLSSFRDDARQRFDAIDLRFDAIDRRFDAIDQRLDDTNRRISVLHEDLIARIALLGEQWTNNSPRRRKPKSGQT